MTRETTLNMSSSDTSWIRAGWTAIGFLFLSSLAFGLLKVFPGYVHWDTGEAFLWSTLGFKFEYVKHPPLLAWIIGVFGLFLPMNWATLTAIAALNLTIGAFAIWRSALLLLDPARAFAVILLYCLSPYHVWHAMKFDHNAILISTWALLIWAFLHALKKPQLLSALLLALAAALTVYAKFQSIIILATIGLISILTQTGRDFLKRTTPYVSVVLFLMLIAPLYFHSASVIGYATSNAEPATFPIQFFEVSLARQIGIGLVASLFLYVYGRNPRLNNQTQTLLGLLSFLPFSLTLLMTILVDLRGSQAWMAPVFICLPIFLMGFVDPEKIRFQMHLKTILHVMLVSLMLGGFLSSYYAFRFGLKNEIEPRIEVINEAAAIWKRASGTEVPLIAGDMPLSVAATIELKHHPKSWAYFDPGFWWASPKLIQDGGTVIFCRPEDSACLQQAHVYFEQQGGFQCHFVKTRERFGLSSPQLNITAFFIPPKGKAFEAHCPS